MASRSTQPAYGEWAQNIFVFFFRWASCTKRDRCCLAENYFTNKFTPRSYFWFYAAFVFSSFYSILSLVFTSQHCLGPPWSLNVWVGGDMWSWMCYSAFMISFIFFLAFIRIGERTRIFMIRWRNQKEKSMQVWFSFSHSMTIPFFTTFRFFLILPSHVTGETTYSYNSNRSISWIESDLSIKSDSLSLPEIDRSNQN